MSKSHLFLKNEFALAQNLNEHEVEIMRKKLQEKLRTIISRERNFFVVVLNLSELWKIVIT